jgi:hypothetical protein
MQDASLPLLQKYIEDCLFLHSALSFIIYHSSYIIHHISFIIHAQLEFVETRAVLDNSTSAAPAAAAAAGGGHHQQVSSSMPPPSSSSLQRRFEGTVAVKSTLTGEVLFGPVTGSAHYRKGWQQVLLIMRFLLGLVSACIMGQYIPTRAQAVGTMGQEVSTRAGGSRYHGASCYY